jgi:hypothetical protein
VNLHDSKPWLTVVALWVSALAIQALAVATNPKFEASASYWLFLIIADTVSFAFYGACVYKYVILTQGGRKAWWKWVGFAFAGLLLVFSFEIGIDELADALLSQRYNNSMTMVFAALAGSPFLTEPDLPESARESSNN